MREVETEKQSLNGEINRLKSEMQRMEASKSVEIANLHTHMNQLEEERKQIAIQLESMRNSAKCDENMDVEQCDMNTLSAKFESMVEHVSTTVNSQITALTQEIESRIKLEFNKIQSQLGACAQDIGNSAKRKRTSGGNTFANDINGTPLNAGNGRRIDFTNLKPPTFPEINESKEVYNLLVSKFDTSVSQQNLINHIVNNTGIENHSFKVTEMKSSKETEINKKYISYKITTLHANVYKAIKDDNLWAPDYSVRDFNDERNVGQNSMPRQNKSRVNVSWQPNRANENFSGYRQRHIPEQRAQLPPRFRNVAKSHQNDFPQSQWNMNGNVRNATAQNTRANRFMGENTTPKTPRMNPRRFDETPTMNQRSAVNDFQQHFRQTSQRTPIRLRRQTTQPNQPRYQ